MEPKHPSEDDNINENFRTSKRNFVPIIFPKIVVADNSLDEDDSDGETDIENLSPEVVNIIQGYEHDSNCSPRTATDGIMKAPPELPEVKDKEIDEEETAENLENETYNTRALTKEASTYELEKFQKNILIVFNQVNVDGYKPRYGTEKDVEALTSTFGKFGFEYAVHTDLTKDELFRELKAFSEMDFTEYGCVVVAVLTHGKKNGLLKAKDQLYSEIEIINHFKVHDKPTLITKPRVLVIQACRGTRDIAGVPVYRAGRVQRDLEEEVEPYYLPVESDILVIHSSYIGNPSYRDEALGSWFIQSLCNKINQLASTHDFESIITEVKREVAIDKYHEVYNRRTYEMDINKQMPVLTSTLIRKLYLKKFGEDTKHLDLSSNVMRKSQNEVLDNVPSTPLQILFGPCSCFLDHFCYIRNCLRHFLEDNPEDETAKAFLSVADTFEDGVEFNTTKQEMLKVICNHLKTKSKDSLYYKYLHFYEI